MSNLDFNSTAMLDLNQYLRNGTVGSGDPSSVASLKQEEEHQLAMAALMNDMNNIRNAQRDYGIQPIGDLFRNRLEDIRDTTQSLYQMIRQRSIDLEYKSEIRMKVPMSFSHRVLVPEA